MKNICRWKKLEIKEVSKHETKTVDDINDRPVEKTGSVGAVRKKPGEARWARVAEQKYLGLKQQKYFSQKTRKMDDGIEVCV